MSDFKIETDTLHLLADAVDNMEAARQRTNNGLIDDNCKDILEKIRICMSLAIGSEIQAYTENKECFTSPERIISVINGVLIKEDKDREISVASEIFQVLTEMDLLKTVNTDYEEDYDPKVDRNKSVIDTIDNELMSNPNVGDNADTTSIAVSIFQELRKANLLKEI